MYSAILKALENKTMKYIGQHDDFYISIFFDKGERIYISTDTLLMGVTNAEELTEEGISWVRANAGTFEQAKHEANVQAYYESEDRIREASEQYRKEQEYKKYIDQLIEEDEREGNNPSLYLQ